MKSSYELAMERLNKSAPIKKLREDQRQRIAELESVYAAKIAEREIFLKSELVTAEGASDYEAIDQLRKQLGSERRVLQEELEEKKARVRDEG